LDVEPEGLATEQGAKAIRHTDCAGSNGGDSTERMDDCWKFDCRVHDMLSGPVDGEFKAAYCLDVFEHIPKANEKRFISNIARSLEDNSILIIGTPSPQSQVHSSKASKKGHVNCKNDKKLKRLMLTYFHNVFVFSMSDEVVHTGFYPMAYYLLALGAGEKQEKL